MNENEYRLEEEYKMKYELTCNNCKETFGTDDIPFRFCPYCGKLLDTSHIFENREKELIDIIKSTILVDEGQYYLNELSGIISKKNKKLKELNDKINNYLSNSR